MSTDAESAMESQVFSIPIEKLSEFLVEDEAEVEGFRQPGAAPLAKQDAYGNTIETSITGGRLVVRVNGKLDHTVQL